MKLKKGFTLIELLVVIAIIAVLMIVVLPNVLRMFNEAKDKAYAVNVKGHISNVDNSIAENIFSSSSVSDGVYSFDEFHFSNYPSDDSLRCGSYQISKGKVVYASNCIVDDKSYCYENNEVSVCGEVDERKLASYNGQLHVCGNKICNSNGDKIRLIGAGSGRSNLHDYDYVTYYHNDTSALALKSWGVNTFRWLIYANTPDASASWQPDNYVVHGDQLIEWISKVIDIFIRNDMYMIIGWNPTGQGGNPLTSKAVEFFTKLATKYPNDPHLIYEIWNEPENYNTWAQIKAHANSVIPAIRAISPNALILVGSPSWDKDIDVVIGDQLPYDNIMYTHHMYSMTLTKEMFDKFKAVVDAGIPVIESETGTSIINENLVEDDKFRFAEAYASMFFDYLDKNGISYMTHGFGEGSTGVNMWNWIDYGNWNSNLPDSVLTNYAKFLKARMKGTSYNYHDVLMVENDYNDSNNCGLYYRSCEWKDKIESIAFKKNLTVPSDAVITWDLSFSQDGSVIGYLVPGSTSGLYKMYVTSNRTIVAYRDSRFLFSYMSKLKSIDFSNFSTKYVTAMSGMFRYDTALETLDLSGFDTDILTHFWYPFNQCKNLKSINFDNWHPKLIGFNQAFNGCSKIEHLDLSGFDMSGVSDFYNVFSNMTSLKTLNISTWNPTNVTDVHQMFRGLSSIESVDMSNFNIPSSANLTNAMQNVKAGATFKVKNQSVIDVLRPTSTNNVNFQIAG